METPGDAVLCSAVLARRPADAYRLARPEGLTGIWRC